jgi:rubrerythrin
LTPTRPATTITTIGGDVVNKSQVNELLLQSLEAEKGGVLIYEAAVRNVVNPELRKEWEGYLAETREHVETLKDVCESLGINPEKETPGRAVVRHIGVSLVQAIEMAEQAGDPAAAQLVACECVVFAETKDHTDWELIGQVAKSTDGKTGAVLLAAYEQIEEEEDSHLYHSKGWCRELWIESLGLDAVLPPPEERLHVKTAIGAAKAQASVRNARRPGDTEPASVR